MKAMILAAGFGKRLEPLTFMRPKALMPVGNRPVIDRSIGYLKEHGVHDIIVNAHHHHQQVVDHLDKGRPFGLNIQVRVEPEILGTGGGIKNTEDFLDQDPFVVMNADVLTNVDITEAFTVHHQNGNLVTLVVHDCEPFNQVQVDSQMNVKDIATENQASRLAFTGIHIIQPEALNDIPRGTYSNIIDCYRNMIHQGKPIRAYLSEGHYWRDMGTIGNYMAANQESLKGRTSLIGPGCRIHNSVKLKEWVVIGENAILEEDVKIQQSILWDDVVVRRGTKVIGSVVTSGKEVATDLLNQIY